MPVPASWGDLPESEERALAFVLPRAAAARSMLDLGCGTGSVLAALLRRAPDAVGVGVDASDVAIGVGRAHLDASSDLARRMTLLAQDVRKLAVERWSPFDLVLALFSLQFLGLSEFYDLAAKVGALLGSGGAFAATVRTTSRSVPASYFDVPGEPNTYVSGEPHEEGMRYHHYAADEIDEAARRMAGRVVHMEERFAYRSYDDAPTRAWWDFVIEC